MGGIIIGTAGYAKLLASGKMWKYGLSKMHYLFLDESNTLEIEGAVSNILMFLRLCRGEIRSIFGSSRRKKSK